MRASVRHTHYQRFSHTNIPAYNDMPSYNWQYSSAGGKVHPIWRVLQYVLLAAGVSVVALLVFFPAAGLIIFWNVLIPVAPLTVVLLPGLWRNICPMATVSMLPRQLGISRDLRVPKHWLGWMAAASVAGLYIVVPARHVMLNFNGLATAIMLALATVAAFTMGMLFKGRSGWCSSLCPIHPVEKFYGSSPLLSFPNAQCGECGVCTAPCPDCTRSVTPAVTGPSDFERNVGTFLIGSFPGFVWGWFQVGDYTQHVGLTEIAVAYGWPFACALISMGLYMAALTVLKSKQQRALLIQVCATAAVGTYYWYRIPMLGGFGEHAGTGLLADLTGVLPWWTPWISHVLTTGFLVWFLIVRPNARASWLIRPEMIPSKPLVHTRYLAPPRPMARAA